MALECQWHIIMVKRYFNPFIMRDSMCVLAVVEASVCPFNCPSHCAALSKQYKLESRNLHCGLTLVSE